MSRIITFYSYKGGVGRTFALANIAVLLAMRDKKVLLMDWDLEAPGLDRYFRQYMPSILANGKGIIHLLHVAFTNIDADWKTYIQPITFEKNNLSKVKNYTISMIASGIGSEDYTERVRGFSWS